MSREERLYSVNLQPQRNTAADYTDVGTTTEMRFAQRSMSGVRTRSFEEPLLKTLDVLSFIEPGGTSAKSTLWDASRSAAGVCASEPASVQSELIIDTSVAAPPSVTSSTVSIASDTVQYTVAARAFLKPADRYTESNLMAFLADKYPEIPEKHRHSLMIGAVTGAQTAAQLHVLLDGAKTGKDKASHVTADGAQRMLSFYNLGLVSEEPFDPNPQVRVSPTEPTPFTSEEPMEEEPEASRRKEPVVILSTNPATRKAKTPRRPLSVQSN